MLYAYHRVRRKGETDWGGESTEGADIFGSLPRGNVEGQNGADPVESRIPLGCSSSFFVIAHYWLVLQSHRHLVPLTFHFIAERLWTWCLLNHSPSSFSLSLFFLFP